MSPSVRQLFVLWTAAAEAVGKWESRGCWRDFQARWESRFLTFPARVFSTAFRAAKFFTIVRCTSGSAYPDNLFSRDVSLAVAEDVAARLVFSVIVSPARRGSLSTRSCAHGNES